MTIHIGNYKSILIEQKIVLSIGDTVVFTINDETLKYRVARQYLNDLNNANNDAIFRKLSLDAKSFCTKYYGYPAQGGSPCWPESHNNDYTALTKVVIALFKEIEKRTAPSWTTDVTIKQPLTKDDCISIKIKTQPHLKIIL